MIDIHTFQLACNTVHFWVMHFNTLRNTGLLREDLLSEEERERKKRFATPELKEKFLYSHVILKLLLAKYLEIPPSKIGYKYGLFHKPFINLKGKTLTFNLSHSREWAAYAFFCGDSVGVDIEERSREVSSLIELSHLIGNEEELRRLQAMHCPDERRGYFMYMWTAREAFLKMLGIGMNDHLSSIRFDESWKAFLPNVKEENSQSYTMMGYVRHIVSESYIASIACSKCPSQVIEHRLQDVADLGFEDIT